MVNNVTKFVTKVMEQNINTRGSTLLFIFLFLSIFIAALNFIYFYYTLFTLQSILIFGINIMSQSESEY